jgi:hypothetical protein
MLSFVSMEANILLRHGAVSWGMDGLGVIRSGEARQA